MSSVKKTSTRKAQSTPSVPSSYRAPALEKGLDILELLALQSEGLILSQIAQKLNRSVQEVYRVVMSLERRGYVLRGPGDDAFRLSLKLFDLASNHLPIRRLIQAAHPVLDRLAMQVEQVVIISVLDGWTTRVVVVSDNPAPIGFRVRLGTQRPLLKTASGRTLIAFQPSSVRYSLEEALGGALRERGEDPKPLIERIADVNRRGYECVSDETLRGITDVSFPIVDSSGEAQAALTMPYLVWVENEVQLAEAEQRLFECADTLSRELGGRLRRPEFPLSTD
ncbi:IclR family transcriptional regulator [Hoeflea sp. WL0058]|uniref:IclR family transcriptional regulator n=1 Tax=Flavimaribacter sediminis TaxID=2865987 RepID=A0AAE2ZJY4_9HYPH|nr:IclR family transcriptional regulator [Flavimaribacter sediminis]MBW8637571.1 IclR family transcriptional regulator [Flavimaribacter sediminis]